MKCKECGLEVAEGSAFCNRCGVRLVPSAPTADASQPPETELWSGRYHWRSMALEIIGLFSLGLAIGVALLVIPGIPNWAVLALACAWSLLALFAAARLLYRIASIRYRLTTERLFFQRGIFHRHMTELELVRVDDVSFTQNLVERLCDVGTVSIASTDADSPRLSVHGIAQPEELKERIRDQMKRLRRGSLHVESI